jgi:hypothetical protein
VDTLVSTGNHWLEPLLVAGFVPICWAIGYRGHRFFDENGNRKHKKQQNRLRVLLAMGLSLFTGGEIAAGPTGYRFERVLVKVCPIFASDAIVRHGCRIHRKNR